MAKEYQNIKGNKVNKTNNQFKLFLLIVSIYTRTILENIILYVYTVTLSKCPQNKNVGVLIQTVKKSVLIVLILLFHLIIVDYGSILDVVIELNDIMRFWTFGHFPLLSKGLVTDK